jgi:ribosomal protein S18 acetylase RimI-like enzyme
MPITSESFKVWEEILRMPNYHILIGEYMGRVVSSVTLIIIQNLTRNMRPYALIENVVTMPEHRNKGYAGHLLKKAVEIAKENNCYKIMLLTGSKNESTLALYKKLGFSDTEKTGFIMKL